MIAGLMVAVLFFSCRHALSIFLLSYRSPGRGGSLARGRERYGQVQEHSGPKRSSSGNRDARRRSGLAGDAAGMTNWRSGGLGFDGQSRGRGLLEWSGLRQSLFPANDEAACVLPTYPFGRREWPISFVRRACGFSPSRHHHHHHHRQPPPAHSCCAPLRRLHLALPGAPLVLPGTVDPPYCQVPSTIRTRRYTHGHACHPA